MPPGVEPVGSAIGALGALARERNLADVERSLLLHTGAFAEKRYAAELTGKAGLAQKAVGVAVERLGQGEEIAGAPALFLDAHAPRHALIFLRAGAVDGDERLTRGEGAPFHAGIHGRLATVESLRRIAVVVLGAGHRLGCERFARSGASGLAVAIEPLSAFVSVSASGAL